MNPEMIILIGFPASTKTSAALTIQENNPNAVILSKEQDDLPELAEKYILEGKTVVIDKTNLTKQARKKFIDIAKKHNVPVEARYFKTSIEDCQIRYLKHIYETSGQISNQQPIKFFKARKGLEEPTKDEGFRYIICNTVPPITWEKKFKNKALFIDLDGTIRATEHLPYKYPTHPDQVELLHPVEKIRAKLESYRSQGYKLIGVTNQSGISRGTLTEPVLQDIFNRTRELLGYTEEEFPILYCPHHPAPIRCFCRKPQSGMPMECIMKLNLNPHFCVMVGDMKTDEELAQRLGMQYYDVKEFWG